MSPAMIRNEFLGILKTINALPTLQIRVFGLFILAIGLFYFFTPPFKRRAITRTGYAKTFDSAKDNPMIQLEKPIDEIIDDFHSAGKTTARIVGVLMVLLGIIGVAGLFSALVIAAGYVIISFVDTIRIIITTLRFKPYVKAIKQQTREYNKKGL